MSWIQASEGPHRLYAVHPSGNNPEEWKRSGEQAAQELVDHKYFPKRAADRSSGELVRVLEYGCGPGRILGPLSKHAEVEAHGVDIAHSYIRECRDHGLFASLVSRDVARAFNGRKFDVVFALTVFIHLNKQDAREAMKYCFEALDSGGIALLQIPIYRKSRDPESWTHIGCFSEHDLVEMAHSVGFEIVELYINDREFDYNNLGPYHSHYQVFRKPALSKGGYLTNRA